MFITKQVTADDKLYYRPVLAIKCSEKACNLLQSHFQGHTSLSPGTSHKVGKWTCSGKGLVRPLQKMLPFLQEAKPAARIVLEAAKWFLLPTKRRYISVGRTFCGVRVGDRIINKNISIKEISEPFRREMESLRVELDTIQANFFKLGGWLSQA